MKTIHIGGALLATAAIALVGLNLPVQSAGKTAPTKAGKANVKNIVLTVEGMH